MKIKKIFLSLLTSLLIISNFGTSHVFAEEGVLEEAEYSATYEFVSDVGEDLPEEVLAFLPESKAGLHNGSKIKNDSFDDVIVENDRFHFLGWNVNDVIVNGKDEHFIGTWQRLKTGTYHAKFLFTQSDFPAAKLPEEVMAQLPKDQDVKFGEEPVIPEIKNVANCEFAGWTIVWWSETEVHYQGVWYNYNKEATNKDLPLIKSNGIISGFDGAWSYGNHFGYIGTSAYLVDGIPVICLNYNKHVPDARTPYTPTGSTGGTESRVLAACEIHGLSQACCQALMDNVERGAGSAYCETGYPDPSLADIPGWGYGSVTVYTPDEDAGAQSFAPYGEIPVWPLKGYIRARKTSAKPYITNGNSLYPLSGFVFGIYSDSSCSNLVTRLTTDASGVSGTYETDSFGNYYSKEISGPDNYNLDTNCKYVGNLSAGATIWAGASNQPKTDPARIHLYKYNERNGRVYGYDEYLDEAEFTVRYYDIENDSEIASKSPFATWVFKPFFNSENTAEVILTNEKDDTTGDYKYYVSGPTEWFVDPGLLLLPVGTITIEETKAPNGFARDENVYIAHIRLDSEGRPYTTFNGGSDILEVDNLDLTQREQLQTITINIQKRDKETGQAAPQGLEDLSGAKFEIRYLNPVDNKKYLVGTVTTNAEGKASLSKDIVGDFDGQDLITGKYYITEIAAPDGYQIDPSEIELDVAPDIYKFTPIEVEEDYSPPELNTAHFEMVHNHPDIYIRGGFKLTKHDSDFMENRPQGDATNLTTTYQVISLNTKDKVVDKNLDNTEDKNTEVCSYGEACFTFTTDANGNYTSRVHLLPKGKWRIEETVPPTGYLVEGNTVSRDFEITYDGQVIDLNDEEYNELLTDDVIRGDVEIAKRDFESKMTNPLGGASLDGAYVQLINRSANPITVHTAEGMIEVPVGAVVPTMDGVRTVEVDKLTHETKEYTAITGLNANGDHGRIVFHDQYLPYGTYDYVEIVAPVGYLTTNDPSRENLVGRFSIREDKVVVEKITLAQQSLVNSVRRGDFEIRKIDADTQDYMGGIEFTIESVTTGEKHSFTTDANGYYSSQTSWNPHSYDTNGGKEDSGLWFGMYIADGDTEYDESVPVNDNLGALPYDMYYIKELRGPNNFGKKMWEGYFWVDRDNQLVPINNVENVSIKLKTIATNDIENSPVPKLIPSTKDAKIIDTVAYENVQPNTEYRLHTVLMNKVTGQPVTDMDGNPVESDTTFTPSSGSGEVVTELVFNMQDLKDGFDGVVFEFLYEGDELAAQHANLEDSGQTVRIPGLRTVALDNNTNAHVGQLGEITVTDTVRYTNLSANKDYTISGVLMDKATGEPVLNEDGEQVTDSVTFRAREKDGEVELTFHFTVKDAGHSYVAFETLEHDMVEYGVHADINDEDQSVHFPKISTLIHSENILQNVIGEGSHRISDIVYYENVSPLHTYTVTGTLLDSETGEVLVDKDGEQILAEATFTPTSNSGETVVEFNLETEDLAGHRLVAFEVLNFNDFDLTRDEDLNNKAETMWVPDLHTTAHADDLDEDGNYFKTVIMDEEAVVIDDVKYDHLQPGKDYILRARLMDKETGEQLVNSFGQPISVEKAFTAEAEEGTLSVEFVLDTRELGDKYLVAFERLLEGDVIIAKHEDLEDEDQTIKVVRPEIHTTATADDGEKTSPFGSVVIVDKVEYLNVKKGREYTIEGTLMGADGNPLLDKDGNPITHTAKVTPTGRNGSVDLEFKFDYIDVDHTKTVVFEKLLVNDYVLAVHEDLEDEGQTVDMILPEIKTTAVDEEGRKATVKDHSVTIVDTIEYKNLNVRNEYEIRGVLMDKATGKPARDALGNIIEATDWFTPETRDGTYDLTFEFDAHRLAYTDKLVAFEYLYLWDVELATHEDINDVDQTVEFLIPEIGTKSFDLSEALKTRKEMASKATGITDVDKIAVLDSRMLLKDIVSYKYLDNEAEYTLKGVLMDKKTGKPLEVSEPENDLVGTWKGAEVVYNGTDENEKALAEMLKGMVEAYETTLTFKNDHTGTMHQEPIPEKIAALEAKGWTVSSEGDEDVQVSYDLINKKIVVNEGAIDYVVIDNKLYMKEGDLWLVYTLVEKGTPATEKATGPIEATIKFRPESDSGETEMVFAFDGSYLNLEDYDVVVFEELDLDYTESLPVFDENGKPKLDEEDNVIWKDVETHEDIAEHKDIEDLSQWMHIWYEKPTLKTTATFSNGEKSHLAGDTAVIVDKVAYTGLDTNITYTLRGVVVSQSDGKAVSKPVEVEFKPATRDGVVEMKFTVDSKDFGNMSVVVFEELYRTRDMLLIGSHKDLKDTDQTVVFYVPKENVNTGSGMDAIIASGVIVVAGVLYLIINRKKEENA